MRHRHFKHLKACRAGNWDRIHAPQSHAPTTRSKINEWQKQPEIQAPDFRLSHPRPDAQHHPVISPLDIISSIAWVYLLILAGAIARRIGLIPKEYDEPIMKVVYMVMIPCFILDKILGAEILRSGMVVFSSIACGYGLIVASVGASFLIGKIAGLQKGTGMRTFALSAGTQNYGYTAAPVVQSLWITATSTSTLAVLFVHNIGVELAMWSFGVMVINGRAGFRWRHLCNGMIIGVLFGLLLVTVRLDHLITGPPREALRLMGAGAFPLGLFIIGCTIMSMIGAERPSARILSAALAARFLVIPAIFLTAAKFLPLATELKQVIVVQAAMPAAVSPIILAKLYNGRPAIAVHIVIITTALSILTLPWIISFACWWIGLEPTIGNTPL